MKDEWDKPRLTVVDRRIGRSAAYGNAAIWAVGNGLVSTTLVVYLALEQGASNEHVGWIIAAPQFAGVLRVATPWLLARVRHRKTFCIALYALSALLLAALPWMAAMPKSPPQVGLTPLIVLWSAYHLAEYLATVALWAWQADVVRPRGRGRFIGRREAWLTAGRIVGLGIVSAITMNWIDASGPRTDLPPSWIVYAVCTTIGASVLLLAVGPLVRMPDIEPSGVSRTQPRPLDARRSPSEFNINDLCAPLLDVRFRRLLLFGVWFSFFNGLTQAAQNSFPKSILAVPLATMLILQTAMRLGQTAACPWIGRVIDRIGNRPVLIASQLLVAIGLACYALVTPDDWTGLIAAWIFWIAYAGLNVGLPNLTLKLALPGQHAYYIALWFAVTGISFGASSILGGRITDAIAANADLFARLPLIQNHWQAIFLGGAALRALGVFWLWRIPKHL